MEPKITTVGQPAFRMGKKAAEILLKQIEDDNAEKITEKIVLETELIIREST